MPYNDFWGCDPPSNEDEPIVLDQCGENGCGSEVCKDSGSCTPPIYVDFTARKKAQSEPMGGNLARGFS